MSQEIHDRDDVVEFRDSFKKSFLNTRIYPPQPKRVNDFVCIVLLTVIDQYQYIHLSRTQITNRQRFVDIYCM